MNQRIMNNSSKTMQMKYITKGGYMMPFSSEYVAREMLEGLNPAQRMAVTTINGEVQANSVAGSGKTKVLVTRVQYMIEVEKIKPNLILCTTFTSKATEEMKERLSKVISAEMLKKINLGTSHSIGRRILARELKELNNPLYKAFENPKDGIVSDRFTIDIVKEMLQKYDNSDIMTEAISEIGVSGFKGKVSALKNANIDHKQFISMVNRSNMNDILMSEFYSTYENKKSQHNKIDFDDMLFMVVRLLQENPTILRKYQNFYQYILVDEAQDNNALQYELIRMLAHPHNNLFIVGDDDQSMYKFRGATPEQFIHLDKEYPNITRINLELNYRSNPQILMTANKLIAHNIERITKELVPARQETKHKAVIYNHFRNEDDEAEYVAEQVLNQKETEGISFKDIFVDYRTNNQTRAIEDAFIRKGIPYVIHGGTTFYERKEVKDIIAYIALAYDKNNNEAFKRIYNVPTRYLGAKFFDKIKGTSSHWDACETAYLDKRERSAINGFKIMINQLEMVLGESEHVYDRAIDFIMNDIGYKNYLLGENDNDEEENPRIANIESLKSLLAKFDDIGNFLSYIQEMTEKAKQDVNGVQCLTIHKSKGLEAHTVFTIGMNEGLLPHWKSVETAFELMSESPIEEERRLAYVAVTRAKEMCFISSTGYYNGRETSPSRFIDEMALIAEDDEDDNEHNKEPDYDNIYPSEYNPITPIHIDDSDLPF